MANPKTSSAVDHESRIAVLENDMQRLLGNGQPGEIDKLHGRISALRDAYSVRQWLPVVLQVIMCMLALVAFFFRH